MHVLDLAPIATHIPTLESVLAFSMQDGLLCGHWSRDGRPPPDRPAAHWASVLQTVERSFAASEMGERPSRVVIHSATRTVAMIAIDAHRALVLSFATRMSADWTEHYLRRACGDAAKLLGSSPQ